MKRKDFLKQINSKPKEVLEKEIRDNQDRLWSLKADLAQGKVKNVAEIKQIKKNVARIRTLLNKM